MDRVVLIACLLAVVLENVSASGKIEVRFLRYENADGAGDNGNACDGFLQITRSECDHYFKLCIDGATGGNDMSSCEIGFVQTGRIHNMDTITFADDIGGTPNPIVFNFTQWTTGGIKIKVDVWDDDNSNAHDHVEILPPEIVSSAPSPQKAAAREQGVRLAGRTVLTADVKIYCDPDYYGRDCGTFCRPQNSDTYGHYDCSPDGARQCHPGWEGRNCDERNGCWSSPCQNGGSCQGGPNWFSCQCLWPYSGSVCDVNEDPCLSAPCGQGGACNSSVIGFTCTCKQGFSGEICEKEDKADPDDKTDGVNDPCLSSPCSSSEICTSAPSGYSCIPRSGKTPLDPSAALTFLAALALIISLS